MTKTTDETSSQMAPEKAEGWGRYSRDSNLVASLAEAKRCQTAALPFILDSGTRKDLYYGMAMHGVVSPQAFCLQSQL